MKLRGMKFIVTGASSGIGKAFTQRLVKAGAVVVAASRDKKRITEIFGDSVYAVSCDVSVHEDVDRLFDEAEQYFGIPDVFVANAGFSYYGKIGEPDWEKNRKIFDTNVLSPIYSLQKLQQMADRTDRQLTFMVTISALGKMVLPGFALYDATKFALDGFVRTYRMERPKNIRIMPVYPSSTITDFWNTAGKAPMPFPPNTAGYVAWHMEYGLRNGASSVYPSLVFIIRCVLVRVLPVDLGVQAIEKLRFKNWLKKYGPGSKKQHDDENSKPRG